MPLLNYTTKISVHTTIGEIQSILARHGAKKIVQDYDDEGHPEAVAFMIDTPMGLRGVRLPSNTEAVQNVLTRQRVKADRDHAERVAWRIVKDWVEAQMAILESEMVQMDEIFLPYMIANNAGETVFQRYRDNQLLIGGSSMLSTSAYGGEEARP